MPAKVLNLLCRYKKIMRGKQVFVGAFHILKFFLLVFLAGFAAQLVAG